MKRLPMLKDYIFMSQRQRTSPFPNYLSMESVTQELRQYTDQTIKKIVIFWQNNLMFAFPEKDSYQKTGQLLVKKIMKNPNWPAQMVIKQKKFGQALVDFSVRANKQIDQKITNKKLISLVVGYEKKYKSVYATYGWVWAAEDFFMAELLKIVEKKVEDKTKAVEILNILTQQPKAMVATIERQAFLKLALKISHQKNWQTSPTAKKLIQSHVQNFFWVTRDYEDPVLTFEGIVIRLVQTLKQDYQAEYQQLIKTLKENEVLKQKYLTTLKFTPSEKKLFAAMRDIAYLKEQRKTNVSKSLYYFDRVLIAVSQRLYLSLKQVRFMKTLEIKAALVSGKDFSSKLNERLKLSVWESSQGKTEVTTGAQAAKLFNEFCKVDKQTKEFFGLPVSPGLAKGPVKIVINPDECDKVEKGDIIVTVQVVPSFSTAIIKSAGLVCDGGHGVTSHPATLAREAGIPCVIQTRFAREVLRDGDLVEVDGYKGIVKKIK